MQQPLYQIHLHGPGHSGRVVRFRVLPATVHREAKATASKLMPTNATMLIYREMLIEQCLLRMIQEVSAPLPEVGVTPELIKQAEEQAKSGGDQRAILAALVAGKRQAMVAELTDAKFTKVNLQMLSTPTDPHAWDNVFTAKDTEELEEHYKYFHELNPAESSVIMGKAIPVTRPSPTS
jgi:hypothetical protein